MRGRRAGDGDDRGAPELRDAGGRAAASPALADVTAAELEDLLRREERLVLVAFWTRGCEPCRELRRQLGDLAGRHADVRLVAVEADSEPEAAARHGVRAFPTLVFFKRGRELHRLKGGALPASTLGLLAEPCRL